MIYLSKLCLEWTLNYGTSALIADVMLGVFFLGAIIGMWPRGEKRKEKS